MVFNPAGIESNKMKIIVIFLVYSVVLTPSFGLPAFTPTGTTVLMDSTAKCSDGRWKNTINNACYESDDYSVLVTDLGLQEGVGHQSTIFGEINFDEERRDMYVVSYYSGVFYHISLYDYYNYYVYDYISRTSHHPTYERDISGHTIFFAFTYKGTTKKHFIKVDLYDRNTNEWFVSKEFEFDGPITYYSYTKLWVNHNFNYFGIVKRAITTEELNNVALGVLPTIDGNSLPISSGSYNFNSVESLYKDLYGVDVCKTSCGVCGDMQFTDNTRFATLGSEECGKIDTNLYNTILRYYILNYTPLDGKPGFDPLVARTRFLATLDFKPTATLNGNVLVVRYKLKPFARALSLGFKTYIKNSYGASLKVPGLTVAYGTEYYEVTSTIDYRSLIDLGCQRTSVPSFACPFFLDFVGLDSYGGHGTLLKTAMFTVEITFNPDTEAITGADVDKMKDQEIDCKCVVVADVKTDLSLCEDSSCTRQATDTSYRLGDTIYLKQKIQDSRFNFFKLSPFSITFDSNTGASPMTTLGPFDYDDSVVGEVTVKIPLVITGKLTITVLSLLIPTDKRLLAEGNEVNPASLEENQQKAITTDFTLTIVGSDEVILEYPKSSEEETNLTLIVGIAAGAVVMVVASILLYCYCVRKSAIAQKETPAKSPDQKEVPIESPVHTEEPMKSSARGEAPIDCPVHIEVPAKDLAVVKATEVDNKVQPQLTTFTSN
eukprot:TRINITY_DN105_c0_g1_i4.p1 TRINITY_DN105_c0_g1~~TRINITY_DN105_c0_g1_i4.p1  ORF type:complete len:777 (-),score=23.22 TRINITY_DN105_c0_g1_i4:146-2296(-)